MEPICNIQSFYSLEKFNKNNAFSLLTLNLAISAWSGTDSPLPEVENFELKNTFKCLDPYGQVYRNMIALYYSKKLNMIIVSFSGTEYLTQWIDDFDFRQVNPSNITSDKQIFVHIQMYNIYNSIRDELISILKSLSNEKTIFISTGHSLGGGLSTVCFFDIAINNIVSKRTLYSFASPRVGNVEFANIINKEKTVMRIANTEDLAVAVPLPILDNCIYSHSSNCISFTNNLGNYNQIHVDSYVNFLKE
jgi:predicted lipase